MPQAQLRFTHIYKLSLTGDTVPIEENAQHLSRTSGNIQALPGFKSDLLSISNVLSCQDELAQF